MNVLTTGGSGLIGSVLTDSLLMDGHRVWILSRNPEKATIQPGAQAVGWDGRTTAGWGALVEEMDAIVNLAGWSLAHWPWTEKNKQRFLDSRIQPGLAVAEAIRQASKRPKVLIQVSAIGYYGPRDEPVTEETPPGRDFGARLCQQWEATTQPVEGMGVRRVVIRTAVVLSLQNVILQLMVLPARLFVGGKLGNGRQGFSWIHIADQVAAIRFLMENEQARGAFNLSAPEPMASAEFLRTIAKVLRRPFWFPVPAFLLRMALGEMSTLVLEGQFVHPKRLLELGFNFRFPKAEGALRDLLEGM
jgi:hypothetical protein